jgi:tetratricopeptide (TPR) repeat protein
MEYEQIESLKREVEKTFGQKVLTSADCYLLSEAILEKTKVKLSFNTLRRFFNLMNSPYSYSMNTVNIFVRFCGFSSNDDFITYYQKGNIDSGNIEHRKLLDYLDHVFKKIKLKDSNDRTFNHLVHETIDFLKKYPGLSTPFHQEIAQTYNGQKIYFEKFINLDKLNSYYGNGLCHYLMANKSKEAKIFGHYFIGLKNWLIMNDTEAAAHFKEVVKYTLGPQTHPLFGSCYFSAHLLLANISDSRYGDILIQAREYYNTIKPGKGRGKIFPLFEHYLSNALILTGQYEEALFYIEEALKKKKNYVFNRTDLNFFESLRLYKSIALLQLGKTKLAKETLSLINPEKFSFLHRQFMTSLYLFAKQHFNKTTAQQIQINYLISETGFQRLQYEFHF